jgi:inner membrane protein
MNTASSQLTERQIQPGGFFYLSWRYVYTWLCGLLMHCCGLLLGRKQLRGNTHAIIGLTTGAAVATHFHVWEFQPVVVVIILAAGASLLPDIDHPGSFISHRLKIFAWPFRLLAHRGFTHSALAILLLLVGFTAAKIDFIHGVALLAGYASHLVADAMTPQGIRLLRLRRAACLRVLWRYPAWPFQLIC